MTLDAFAKSVVDSSPFGGGNGMVMRADVIDRVLSTGTQDPNYAQLPVVYMTPRGTPLTQEKVKIFSQGDGAIMLLWQIKVLRKGCC